MNEVWHMQLRHWATWVCLLACAGAVGCTKSEAARFTLNREGKDLGELDETQRQALGHVSTALVAAFGTPDQPYVFPEAGLDLHKIEIASGPFASDQMGKQRGLYRQHCAHCHGVTGDGAGPTALFLNPYPRDYRRGLFKFKSTERAARPTTADLKRVLLDGVAGTAMPSFALLPEDEIDALVEYVKYLAIRGETEQFLYEFMVNEGEGSPPTREFIVEQLAPVAEAWQQAESQVVAVPEKPPVDVAAGKKLFLGPVAQCSKCHGPTGLGDGGEESFDDWNKDKKLENAHLFTLPRQALLPRNLRLGIYRGGRRPVDLYRRIHAGINGAPMPSAPQGEQGLKPEDIWHIVDYVRSLPYESESGSTAAGSGQHAALNRPVN